MSADQSDHELAMSAAAKAVGQPLAQRVATIADGIGDKSPESETRGSGPRFKYHAARDVYGWWRPHLQRQGIIIIPRVVSFTVDEVTVDSKNSGPRHTWLTSMLVEFTITDGVESITGCAFGQGDDPGDKGAGKAMTYAEKNFLLGLGMNGAEQDVEDDERTTDRYYGTGRYRDRDEERREEREPDRLSSGRESVVIGDSKIEGIQRGGRSTNATEAQIRRLRDLAREANIGARDIAVMAERILGDRVELPEEGEGDPGEALRSYLDSLKSVDIGKLIQELADGGREPVDSGLGY